MIEFKKLTQALNGAAVRREALTGKIVGVSVRTAYVTVEWPNGRRSAIHASDPFLELVDQPAASPVGKRAAPAKRKG